MTDERGPVTPEQYDKANAMTPRLDVPNWRTESDDYMDAERDTRPVAEARCSGSGDCEYPYCACPREMDDEAERQRPAEWGWWSV